MNTAELLSRANYNIQLANEALLSAGHGGREQIVDDQIFNKFRSSSLSFIGHIYGTNHSHYILFLTNVKDHYVSHVAAGSGILESISFEIEQGWLQSTKGLISAEIFSSFLEMAEHLLDEDYKDAAAVIAGSALESHLKQLCEKNEIPLVIEKNGNLIHKKTDLLNSELAKAEVYNKLDQKQVTTLLDLRNKAAHSKYDQYTKEQVNLMVQSIIDFIARNPV